MKDSKFSAERRQVLATAGAVAAAIPASALLGSRTVFAAMVDPASGQAVALQYKEVSEVEGKMCMNCALYQPVDSVDGGGNCPLFQGVNVHDEAWCTAWAPRG